MASASSNSRQVPGFDSKRRFVRKRGERANGYVEFEFAIGEPELFVELILSPADFDEFCAIHKAEMLAERDVDDSPDSDWNWRLADATGTRFK